MPKMNELTVLIENKPGTLLALGEALGRAKVNILAFVADEVEGQSRVRLVTDNPAKAKKALQAMTLPVSEEDVLIVVLKNKPGTLASVAGKLGSAGINVNRAYCGAEAGSKKQLVVFSVSDLKQAAKAFK
jgi:hypothetical protein